MLIVSILKSGENTLNLSFENVDDLSEEQLRSFYQAVLDLPFIADTFAHAFVPNSTGNITAKAALEASAYGEYVYSFKSKSFPSLTVICDGSQDLNTCGSAIASKIYDALTKHGVPFEIPGLHVDNHPKFRM
jgi:hypothetical protein